MTEPARKYYDLVRELAITDFKLKYQGSVLGYLWSFAKPLMLFAVLYAVFTKVIRLGAGIEHYPVYLLLGIVLWTYFTDSTMTAMSSIVDRQDLIRKVYFPRLVILIGASVSSLLTLLINLVIILVFLLVAGIHPAWSWLLFPLLAIELYVLSLGCSLLLACLYVKFRDFRHIWEVILQIGFYATPIIYPLTLVPHRYLPVFLINPLAQIIQDARYILVTHSTLLVGSTVALPFKLIPYLIPVVIFIVGYEYFSANAAKFAEEV